MNWLKTALSNTAEVVGSFLWGFLKAITDPFFWAIQALCEGIVALIEGMCDGL